MSTSNNVVDLVWQGSTTIVIGVLNIREARNWEIFLRGLTCWYYGITGQWTAWTAPTLTSLHRIFVDHTDHRALTWRDASFGRDML
jgi:hypothetical protein